MNKRVKNRVLPAVIGILLLGTLIFRILSPQMKYSDSERRVLATMPELSVANVLSGKFMENFEDYALDQFPGRDMFRSVKAFFEHYILQKKDNNDIYLADGHIAKLEYPMNKDMLNHATERFGYIYEEYLKPCGITPYLSIIPDKNRYLAEENGYLHIDYDALTEYVRSRTEYMTYVDITKCLDANDYYSTDTHWKQECIQDVASEIAGVMQADIEAEYEVKQLVNPFYGVYYGQAALPLTPDKINYLTNAELEQCIVTSYDTGLPKEVSFYDMEKADGKDPYEMFLSGNQAVLTIENPKAEKDKELVLFRDSFGSSLAPLLVPGYKKITLVDIRYIQSSMLDNYVSFEDADVLFLYSTLVLNNSLALK